MWAAKPNLTGAQIKQLLLQAAAAHPPSDPRLASWVAHNANARAELWGNGLLDAHEAVKLALSQP
jgi:hypothetical protein